MSFAKTNLLNVYTYIYQGNMSFAKKNLLIVYKFIYQGNRIQYVLFFFFCKKK